MLLLPFFAALSGRWVRGRRTERRGPARSTESEASDDRLDNDTPNLHRSVEAQTPISKPGMLFFAGSLLIPFAIFLLHSWMFRDWINDDAGISFVYARNLAEGYGLVSQPGAEPVEGYSNFLWVVTLAPFFALDLFDPIFTPKLLSAALVLSSFILVQRAVAPFTSLGTTTVGLSLLSMNTSFVVWTSSGLENALYVFVLSALAVVCLRMFAADRPLHSLAILAGTLGACAALTRPEGLIYAICFPALCLARGARSELGRLQFARCLGSYAATFLTGFGSYLLFRRAYFGDWLPNTYWAKGGPEWNEIIAVATLQPETVTKLMTLTTSVAGGFGNITIALVLLATVILATKRRLREIHVVLGLFWGVSVVAYLLLPTDWMPEYRFATPSYVFFYLYLASLALAWIRELGLTRRPRRLVATLLVVVFAAGSLYVARRSSRFARRPTVPFTEVAEVFGARFNDYARRFGIENGSILLPDVGGTLYVSELRVYDLAGLCDRRIARLLGHGREGYSRDQRGFYDYVFEEIRPTFIHTHAKWTHMAALDEDPRFRRDYLPLYEYVDPRIERDLGQIVYSGDFVRKDAVREDDLPTLREIRRELARESADDE